jgi:hypothetical protein
MERIINCIKGSAYRAIHCTKKTKLVRYCNIESTGSHIWFNGYKPVMVQSVSSLVKTRSEMFPRCVIFCKLGLNWCKPIRKSTANWYSRTSSQFSWHSSELCYHVSDNSQNTYFRHRWCSKPAYAAQTPIVVNLFYWYIHLTPKIHGILGILKCSTNINNQI